MQGYNVIQLPESHWQWNLAAPTGGLVSTPNDMGKYLQANLNPPDSALGRAITLSQKNGLGWDSAPGAAVVWKVGGSYGFSSYVMIDQTRQEAWVALSNLGSVYSAGNFPGYALFGGLRPDIFGFNLSENSLNTFVGTYSNPQQSGSITITKPGHFLRLNGGDVNSDYRLQALSATDFAATDDVHYIGYHKITFKTDAQGKVAGFTFHYNDGTGHYSDFIFTKIN